MHLQHFSFLLCEAELVCIAIQVNNSYILTLIELCLALTIFKYCRVFLLIISIFRKLIIFLLIVSQPIEHSKKTVISKIYGYFSQFWISRPISSNFHLKMVKFKACFYKNFTTDIMAFPK